MYQVVSADSHLEISPERFTHRVPEKYRDRAPRVIKLADGGEAILVENRPLVAAWPESQWGAARVALANRSLLGWPARL